MTLPGSLLRLKSPRFVLLAFALLGTAIYSTPCACAFGGPQQTRYVGVVQSIDYKNKTITFQPGPDGKTLSLGWTFETSFLADKRKVTADALKAGTKVKVKYHSPLFGRESASRVEWEQAPNSPVR